ncbi:MAG TPA: hypothetical protein VGL81_03170 [Polyangiaceae bacterium]|jgi:hypothetical protein
MNRGFSGFFGRARAALAAAVALGSLIAFAPLLPACSSGSKSPGPAAPSCNQAKCAAGNECIDDGSGSGPVCHEVCTGQTCPFGWYCNDGAVVSPSAAQSGTPTNWCVQGTTPLSATAGQWGTGCLPSGGESNNKACDSADSFSCYGQTPTDADAFCTIFGCAADSDCPGGWWCETVDTAPSVKTATRSFGKTRTVCAPRQYCATCLMDHDCPPSAAGTQQHCIQTGTGADGGTTPGYCSPQCGSTSDCTLDAKCETQWSVCTPAQGTTCKSDDDCPPAQEGGGAVYQHCDQGTCTPECGSSSDCTGTGQKCGSLSTCEPRAGTCLGAGGFCSPCRADSDCTGGGYCLYADYSTERYCSLPVAKGTCANPNMSGVILNAASAGQCPKAPAGSAASSTTEGAVGCTFSSTTLAPPNQCVALTSISDGNGGQTQVVGCWTVNR